MDTLRELPQRAVGYSCHLANSLCGYIPAEAYGVLNLITVIYIAADVINVIMKSDEVGLKMLTGALDVLLWQILATVVLPTIVINAVQYVAIRFIPLDPDIVCAVSGLLILPIIMKPIDESAECIMEKTFRQYIGGGGGQ